MICPECGTGPFEGKFCPRCGTPVAPANSSTQETTKTPPPQMSRI